METIHIIVTRIDWDADDENELKDLPQKIELDVTENDIDNITDIYELEDYVSDYITDETGFCHRGFDMRIYYNTIYGMVYCAERYDAETSKSFYDIYDDNGTYYGELDRSNLDGITASDIEHQIGLNRIN